MAKKRKRKPSKFDQMLERYGMAAVVTWFGIFFSSIGMFWLLLELGTDVNAIVETVVGWWGGDPSSWTEASAGLGQLALAYLATQVVKPLRVGLFLVLTPVVARFMGTGKASPTPSGDTASADPSEASDESRPTAG